jgi:hypothetical protein
VSVRVGQVVSSTARNVFPQRFAAAYDGVALPAVYREFIASGSYIPFKRSFIRGLSTYGPSDVELNLAAPALLKRDELFAESDIDADDAATFHPIAMLRESPQFLAIRTADEAAPVFLWHHETGAFQPQFDTLAAFVAKLRTPRQVRDERAKAQQVFASIRRECKPALDRARRAFDGGRLDAAAAALDAVLRSRSPIRYNGRNDFAAIGILCACFNLRGRVWLAKGELARARQAFIDAIACGGTAYWEAVVDAVVTSFLLGDVPQAVAEAGDISLEEYGVSPGPIVRRNFTTQQIDRIAAIAASDTPPDAQHALAATVLTWVAAAEEPLSP